MIANKLLLTTPTYPYPTLPANESLTDAMGQRFSKGDNIFTSISHTHNYGNHILAQNVETPTVLLEYPRWEHFTKEVDKGYEYIGISAYPVHMDSVLKMCEYIRKNSPETKIMLGSYAAQAFMASFDAEEQKKYVDYAIKGEGVQFMRKLFGEDPNQPIEQKLMPKCGGSLWWLDKYPKGNIGFLVSGLGCPGACDFCSSTEMFGYKRLQMLTPEELVNHMALYYKYFPDVCQVFVIEEDHFRHPEYLAKTREYWKEHPKVVENVDWFGFGSVDNIWNFADKYGWDALGELGIGAIFIGVESKFAGEHGYSKRAEIDAQELFAKLHSMGIRSIGAWICGWDFHDHSNMYEDLNYFVSCKPTWQQITRMSPFPGTDLWRKLKEDGRVMDVPWEDVHFWSGAQKNIALEPHETLNLVEYGYDLLYKTWGPSLHRKLEVLLNGYEYSMNSDNPLMRDHKSLFFKEQASILYNLLDGMDRYAPNGVVRRRIIKTKERYHELLGPETSTQKFLTKICNMLMKKFVKKNQFDPFNRYPKQEPAKKYIYDKSKKLKEGDIPYKTKVLTKKKPFDMRWENFKMKRLNNLVKIREPFVRKRGDPVLNKYLKGIVKDRNWHVAF